MDLTWGPSGEEVGLPAATVASVERAASMRAWTTWPSPVLQGLYSFGKQVVEKVETEHALMENGRFVYHMLHSPMCKHLVNFFTSCGSCWSAM